ncbi:MAG: right-handed parallel beta-helix repeat-containing protein [Burkholderiales bacterium]|nr:right-handed parallel beta-helix repeat-containing protein [Burkholderiales bacterium]MBK8664833.1 right-handed parallel beta-helix repeat-containing protein [Burkholderiales bacterium]
MSASSKLLLAALLAASMSAQAATYIVSSNADSGVGTLRTAIVSANANCQADTINFSSAMTITLTTALPAIKCAGLTIDATPWANPSTSMIPAGATVGHPAAAFPPIPRPGVVLTISSGVAGGNNGLNIQADNVTVRSLSIRGFDDGIRTQGDHTGIVIESNYVGLLETATDIAAAIPALNDRNCNGVHIVKTTNTAGTVGVTVRNNLIAYPNLRGVYVDGGGAWHVTDVTASQGNGKGFNLTLADNWIERTGEQPSTPSTLRSKCSTNAQGFAATSGGGIEIEDTTAPSLRITGNHLSGQPTLVSASSTVLNGSNGIEINQTRRSSLPNAPADGGSCTSCVISGNAISGYLNGIVTLAAQNSFFGLVASTSAANIMDDLTLSGNLVSGNLMGITYGGDKTAPTKASIVSDNLAKNNYAVGIALTGQNTSATGNIVQGNAVGILAGDLLSSLFARARNLSIFQNTVVDNTLSPPALVQGNAGVAVANAGTTTVISQNSISRNAGLGIDLLTSANVWGVTPNDNGDTDTGPNALMNKPVFHRKSDPAPGVVLRGRQVTFTGWARPGAALEFFLVSPDAADPSGFGEGLRYLCSGTAGTTTDPQPPNPNLSGEGEDNAAAGFSVSCTLPADVVPTADLVFSATATDTTAKVTSEFSQGRQVDQFIPNVRLTCTPNQLTDSTGQNGPANCTVSLEDGAVAPTELTVAFTPPPSGNPRYALSNCSSPVKIAAGASSALACTILANANDVAGDGDVTAAVSLDTPPANAGYALGTSTLDQVTIVNDDLPIIVLECDRLVVYDSPGSSNVAHCTARVSNGTAPANLAIGFTPPSGPYLRYTLSNCASPVTIPAGATSAMACTITATPNTDVGDGSVDVVLRLTEPGPNAGYLLGQPASITVTVADDDHPPPPIGIPTLGEWGGAGLSLALLALARRRLNGRRNDH